jgi:hypothetical protein
MNHFEASARAVKVSGLVATLARFTSYRGSQVTAWELLEWSDASWQLLAFAAGVTAPSVKTRSAVVGRVSEAEALAFRANAERAGGVG